MPYKIELRPLATIEILEAYELKMLYMQFFKDDFTEEWKKITADADFSSVTDEEIVAAIQSKRYKPE